ncbi:Uncharacterised protein [Mycobacterium tuberculosis]|nr:Uncharacterised protein [Mycobacterium tuberculosis]CKR90952.1 Uncharacterised protein [Mycobacterium tuberculosis]CNU97033.1 Uncharacterised protein [Mycobacterium tuberculosis]
MNAVTAHADTSSAPAGNSELSETHATAPACSPWNALLTTCDPMSATAGSNDMDCMCLSLDCAGSGPNDEI